nr:MAG TPA: hypothetical protein [Caudoviricetes sp.]
MQIKYYLNTSRITFNSQQMKPGKFTSKFRARI